MGNQKIRQFSGEDWGSQRGVAGGRGGLWEGCGLCIFSVMIVGGVWSVYILSNDSGRGVISSDMIVGGVWSVYILSNDSGRGVISSDMIVGGVWSVYILSNNSGRGVVSSVMIVGGV